MPKAKKVNDVAGPEETTASPTSRPIIVTHGPMVKDPMVQEEEKDDSPKTAKKTLTPPSQKVVKPPTAAKQPESTESAPKVETEPKPAETKVTRSSADSEAVDTDSSEAAEVGAVADQAKDKKKDDEQAKAEAEKKAHIDQLVLEKKYFVPLSVSHHKQAKKSWTITFILLILLALGALIYQIGLV